MTKLERRLQDAASDLNEHVRSTFAAPDFEPVRPPRPTRKLALAAAAAALCVVSVLAIALIAPFDSDTPIADEPATVAPTMPATDAEAVPTAPTGVSYTWVRVDDPDLGGEGNQTIYSIRSVSSGLMAVGSDNDRPAIWYSDDGFDWTRLDDATGAFGSENSAYGDESVMWLTDIADDGSRMVAVGIDLLNRAGVSSAADPQVLSIAVWHSDDGITWTRVPHDDSFEVRSGAIPSVKASSSGAGLTAVGSDAIWTSPDGVGWTRFEAPGWEVTDITATTDGMLLVGALGPDLSLFREAAWYSNDGQSWNAAAVETQPTSDRWWSRFIGVTRAGDGYLALGATPKRLVWFSENGHSWTYRGGFGENDGYERDWLSDLAATGDTVIVAGARGTHSMGSGATLWISTDGGSTWGVVEECDDPAGIFGNARSDTRNSSADTILATDGRFLVGGWFGGGTEIDGDRVGTQDAAVWIGSPTDS